RIILHDYRAALDHGERFAQAFDSRPDRGGWAEIEDHHVVLRMVEDLYEGEFQLDASALAQAALEHRELQPFPVAVHQSEDAAPAALVGDIVRDDVEVLV